MAIASEGMVSAEKRPICNASCNACQVETTTIVNGVTKVRREEKRAASSNCEPDGDLYHFCSGIFADPDYCP